MTNWKVHALAVAVLLFASSPRNASATEPGFAIGARLGYGFPFGAIWPAGEGRHGLRLGELAVGSVPIGLDLGYQLDRHWFAGGYADLAAIPVVDNGGVATGFQVGANVRYFLVPEQRVTPWFGLGAGYESLSYVSGSSRLLTGWQFANLFMGVDYFATSHVGFGPYANFSIGEFTQLDGSKVSETLALHEWFVIGVSGVFCLGAKL